MYKNNKERLRQKAAYSILIIRSLFPDAKDPYIEKEAQKMMGLSDGLVAAMVTRICPEEVKRLPEMGVSFSEGDVVVSINRKIDWR